MNWWLNAAKFPFRGTKCVFIRCFPLVGSCCLEFYFTLDESRAPANGESTVCLEGAKGGLKVNQIECLSFDKLFQYIATDGRGAEEEMCFSLLIRYATKGIYINLSLKLLAPVFLLSLMSHNGLYSLIATVCCPTGFTEKFRFNIYCKADMEVFARSRKILLYENVCIPRHSNMR